MGIQDVVLAPIYLAVLFVFFKTFQRKWTTPLTRKYYIPGLFAKFGGALFLGLIYTFYYQGGDTRVYFDLAQPIQACFYNVSPMSALKIIFGFYEEFDPNTYDFLNYNIFYVKNDHRTMFIIRLVAVTSLFSFHTYLINAFFFAAFSFWGSWLLLQTLVDMYPQLARKLAISVLFMPSIVCWGSGLMKDSICFGALGILFHGFYFGIIKRQALPRNSLLMFLGAYLLYAIRLHILMSLLPALALWLYLGYMKSIRSVATKVVIAPFLVLAAVTLGYFAVLRISADSEYDVEKIAAKAQVTATYLNKTAAQSQGSAYEIAEFDGTIIGMLRQLPFGITVTLFRPFLWEARNPVALLSALESSFFIYLTFMAFFRIKWSKLVHIFQTQPMVPVSLAFALSFAFAVGITSGNFGTLVRYKIPLMPFYLTAIWVILAFNQKKKRARPIIAPRQMAP
jgi:hypothetical protein